jgi:protein PhnA
MSIETALQIRSNSKCELCSAEDNLVVYEVPPKSNGNEENCIYICDSCHQQIGNPEKIDMHHWHCLNDSMWSQIPAVQVMSWRLLKQLSNETWAQNLFDMLYLDDQTLNWAESVNEEKNDNHDIKHIDSNDSLLTAGDSVILIKDLNVKGTSFTAKRGTTVRGISLVRDNEKQIEGRINGQQIVILTKFVKKST